MGRVLQRYILAFLALLLLGLPTLACARTLYYLNIPETILKAGSIVPFELNPNDEFRLFFHYHNGTGKPLTLYIHTSESVEVQMETFDIDLSPEMAGLASTKNYFNKTKRSILNQKVQLPANYTISGMIDGITKNPTKVNVSFNDLDGTSLFPGSKVIMEPSAVREYTVDVTKTNWTQISLGGNGESKIPGCYGVLYKIKVVSAKAKTIRVFMSGRGGTVRVPYVKESKLYITETLKPRKFYSIFELKLKPNEPIEFETLPVGGYSYPLMIVFKG